MYALLRMRCVHRRRCYHKTKTIQIRPTQQNLLVSVNKENSIFEFECVRVCVCHMLMAKLERKPTSKWKKPQNITMFHHIFIFLLLQNHTANRVLCPYTIHICWCTTLFSHPNYFERLLFCSSFLFSSYFLLLQKPCFQSPFGVVFVFAFLV